MVLEDFDKFEGEFFSLVEDHITEQATKFGLVVNCIPDGVGNIDIDDRRLNVWVDLITDRIYKFTID
jgi:hypothetical protein